MLKRIAVQQARVGMFVQEFCGSWISHPFWTPRLLIADQATLDALQSSDVREVVIDLERGIDVPVKASGPAPLLSCTTAEPAVTPPAPLGPLSNSVQEELDTARRLVSRGKQDVARMFSDIRMGRAIESQGLQHLISDMSASLLRNSQALLSLARIKTRDEYTYLHSVAVAALMLALARHLQLDEETVQLAGFAGLLHDAGKTVMPEAILNKPGSLTPAEYAIMRNHPVEGERLLRSMDMLPEAVLEVCLHHHEKFDGTGYPAGQSGQGISLLSRMAAICDVYDAVTSNRAYRDGWDPSLALNRMATWRGHFDADLFAGFVQMLGIYPVGSLVRLKSERLAVVCGQSEGSLLKPQLRVFYSLSRSQRILPEWLNLAEPDSADNIVGREDPQHWGFVDLERLWMQID